MREVLEGVPLRAGLGVDVDFVVEGGEAERRQVDDGLLEGLAPEAGVLHVVEGPVELDVGAALDLVLGGHDDVAGEEVQCCDEALALLR